MKTIVTGLLILGMTNLVNSQSQTFTGQTGVLNSQNIAMNHPKNETYLSKVRNIDNLVSVNRLENTAGTYDLTKTPFFKNSYDSYEVVFKNSTGNILAHYDKAGNLLNAVEEFHNVSLPIAVKTTIKEKYPDWIINKTTYKVKYFNGKDVKKVYNVQIHKENKKMNLKIDSNGTLLLKK